ncbi:G-type lectin S-receptor-like serine/threonine-protein kinase At1g11330 [Cicer arietinum]|uniref:non-specific serine/threonine protein kinase n=1 Tax=Cicer arietinum TaxID=3827 RepID=A0A1S3EEP5_CICAR|nr:G-type lectin S-receptor-like serine/threonine-protein kinase At1g11330 [Cicer arietinum]
MCYVYNSDKGCQKWEDIHTCRVPGEVFQKKSGSPRYVNTTYEENVSYEYNNCRTICWRNCTCTGFREFYINNTRCQFYFGNSTLDVNLEDDDHFYILDRAKIAPHGKIKWVWICAIIAATLLVTFLSILFLAITTKKYRLKEKNRKRMEATNESYAIKDLEDDLKEHDIKVFNYSSVLAAMMNFTPENKLGEGGYGPVYKVTYYTRRMLLDWKKCFHIIEGISQGLLYLHKYSRLKIIHRDLKASNILLDENMNPKISDFGMARMFAEYESTANTNRIVGTCGYMSPEYVMEGICSTKSDVYSFGVLLLEIICGRRNNSFYDADRPLNLIGYAWELWNDGQCLKLMDSSLSDTFISDEVQRCIHVGLLCVEQYANDRPPMSDVVTMLTNKSAHFTLPRRPAFYVERDILDGATTSNVPNTYSTNETFTSSDGA